MPNKFDQNTVQQYGGVKWAKDQINLLYPTAIDDQIAGYHQVRSSLNDIIDKLDSANASLQASWSGDASVAASQTFTDTSNHARNVVSTVDNTVTQLQNAKAAAANAQAAMKTVPNEVPVPSGGFFGAITNTASDIFTGTDPTQQAQQHNTAARTQAAEVLNTLSESYDASARNMTSIAAGHGEGFTPSNPPPAGTFNLGSGSYGGGTGAAAGYARNFATTAGTASTPAGAGSVKSGVFEDPHTGSATQVAGLVPVSETVPMMPVGTQGPGPGGVATLPPFEPLPVDGGLTVPPAETGKLGPLGEENLLGEGLGGGETSPGGLSKFSSSNVFGEGGFGSESGGVSSRGSSLGNGALNGEGEPGSGGATGAVAGEEQAGMQPGMGARGAGGMSGDEELGPSKYSRGRFFGGDEPGAGGEEWIQPSVGGNESLLVKEGKPGSGPGRVRSAYEQATDAEGNPLHMMRGAGARGGHHDDEDDERGDRPEYLKEDPEWWQSAQKVAPPVVE